MADRTSHEATFLAHLAIVERVAAAASRRQGLVGDDAADFASWIKLKLVEDDYAVFRKFRGESAVSTYLTVVIAMLARDYRVQQRGRWRPSAAALREGPLAVRLETLVHRGGYSLGAAAEQLRTAGETTLSDAELARLFGRLPARVPMRPVAVGAEPLASVEAETGADVLVAREEDDGARRETERMLYEAMVPLPVEDRLMLRMRFWESMSVADIARGLAVEQKPLYRRLDRLLAELRARLASAGVTTQSVRDLLDRAAP